MSFDIYFYCFRAGSPANFSRQRFERIFAAHVIERDTSDSMECLRLKYPDGGGGYVYIKSGEEVDGFSVNRPGGNALFEDLFLLMKEVGACIFWPGFGSCLVVAELGVVADLHPHVPAGAGPVTTVNSGAEILGAISRS
jgi:hypothetical protein